MKPSVIHKTILAIALLGLTCCSSGGGGKDGGGDNVLMTLPVPELILRSLSTDRLSGSLRVFNEEGEVMAELKLYLDGDMLRAEPAELPMGDAYTFVVVFYL